MNIDRLKKTVLFIGGSLGARSVNRALRSLHGQIKENEEVQFVWQCGKVYFDEYATCETAKLSNVHILQFIEDMDVAYKAADLVVCRAGALTISEIQILGKPTILIPSPNVAEDHQSKNAKALVDKNAAVLIEDDRIEEKLITTILEVLGDDQKIKELSENVKSMSRPNATRDIVDELEKLINKQ